MLKPIWLAILEFLSSYPHYEYPTSSELCNVCSAIYVRKITDQLVLTFSAAEILSNAGFKLPSKDDICNTCVTESVEKYVMDERLKNEWKIISKYLTSGTITQNVELLKSIQRAGLKEASLKLHTNGVFDLTNETESQPESHNFVEGSETGSESYDSVSDFDTKKSSSTCSIQSAACYIVNRKLLKEWKNIRKAAKYSQVIKYAERMYCFICLFEFGKTQLKQNKKSW